MSLLALKIGSAPGGTTFGPGGTPNCLLWLRSDKIHPSSPEVVELGVGNVVEKWIDQSGSGNDVVSVPGFEPILIPNSFNCNGVFKDVVRFNGIDEFLWNTSFPFSGAQKFSIFIAFKAGNDDASLLSIRDNETGTLTDGLSVGIQPNIFVTEVETDTDKKTIARSQVYATGLVVIYEVFVDLGEASDELRIRINGSEETQLSLAGGSVKTDSNELNIGRFGPGGKYYNGDMVEIIMFGNDNESTRTTVETYLFNKWCITPLGAGPGETQGTYWWYDGNIGLPFSGDGSVFAVDTWEDLSGRHLVASQSDSSLQPSYSQVYNNGVGAVNMGDSVGVTPYFTDVPPAAFLEALGANHNLDEVTGFSIVQMVSDEIGGNVGNIFALGDGGERQLVLNHTATADGANLIVKTVSGPLTSYPIPGIFPDGRQLNNGAPPNSRFVLSLKILNVDLVAGTVEWFTSVPSESSLTASVAPISIPALAGATLDVGTSLRLAGKFPMSTIPGQDGITYISDIALYDHVLSSSERQSIHDYFSLKYNDSPDVLLFTPFQTTTPNQVIIPYYLTNANDSGHVAVTGSSPAFFRDTSPGVSTTPGNGSNPLFVGTDSVTGGGVLNSPVFVDTVPGPGTYFYAARMFEPVALLAPPGLIAYNPSPGSNEVSITVV